MTNSHQYIVDRCRIGLMTRMSRLICVIIAQLAMISPINTWAYSPYTNNELDQLEKEFIQQINQSNSVLRNSLANQYINHLSKTLANHGQIAQPIFFIVKSNEINAFAGPGGYIGVNSQLILASANESELAAVMAHEMAHVRQHHLYRMIEHEKQMRIPMMASLLASIALGALNPALGSSAMMASMTGFAQNSISFTRSNEKEADRIGIDMLIKSGLDPRGMASFFRKMQENSRYYYTDNIPTILRSHPLDEDRIAEAENRCPAPNLKGYPDELNYHLFKELIRTSVAADSKQLLDYYHHECPNINNSSNIACQYGYALSLLRMNQYKLAEERLVPLLQLHSDNLYFVISMAQIEQGHEHYASAIQRLRTLHDNYPNEYAVTFEYAQALIAGSQLNEAVNILLKGFRQYNNDLPICELLARAQAENHRKDYAYFTKAQCLLLQGQRHEALQTLKIAKSFAQKDLMLQERIVAKSEDITNNQ